MAENDKREPLWAFAALDEYCLPSDTVKRTVATRLSGFWRNLGLKKVEKEPESRPNDFERLKRRQLDHAAPLPIWRDAAAALKGSVAETLSNQGTSQSVAVVGAPFSGHAKALGVLTGRAGWRLIAPPSLRQILENDSHWIDAFTQGTSPWAMPMLERCFLRHAKGLHLVRRLLEAYIAGRLGRGVLGCGSWGWSFLQKVSAQTEAIPAVTPQAFDAQRLQRWFSDCACRHQQENLLRFRLMGEERDLLAPAKPADYDDARADRYFTHLAAHSRKIAGVAWPVWRESLRQDNPEASGKAPASKGTDNADVIRVLPWNALELPSLPSLERPCGAFVLHALLIHNGLPQAILPELLSLGSDRITQALVQLRSAGIVAHRNKRWWVTPLAYPAVRSYLRDENYLTDPM